MVHLWNAPENISKISMSQNIWDIGYIPSTLPAVMGSRRLYSLAFLAPSQPLSQFYLVTAITFILTVTPSWDRPLNPSLWARVNSAGPVIA